jgi:hypothetical protein
MKLTTLAAIAALSLTTAANAATVSITAVLDEISFNTETITFATGSSAFSQTTSTSYQTYQSWDVGTQYTFMWDDSVETPECPYAVVSASSASCASPVSGGFTFVGGELSYLDDHYWSAETLADVSLFYGAAMKFTVSAYTYDSAPSPVPLPAGMAFMLTSLLGLGAVKRLRAHA